MNTYDLAVPAIGTQDQWELLCKQAGELSHFKFILSLPSSKYDYLNILKYSF